MWVFGGFGGPGSYIRTTQRYMIFTPAQRGPTRSRCGGAGPVALLTVAFDGCTGIVCLSVPTRRECLAYGVEASLAALGDTGRTREPGAPLWQLPAAVRVESTP